MSVTLKRRTLLPAISVAILFISSTANAESCVGAPCLLKARDVLEGAVSTTFVIVGLPLMSSHQTTESSSDGWFGYAAAVADDAAVVIATNGEIKGPYFESARLRYQESGNSLGHLSDVGFATLLLTTNTY